MLGIKDFENMFETIIHSMKKRGRDISDIEKIRDMLKKKNILITNLDAKRAERNKISAQHKGKIEDEIILQNIKNLKSDIEQLEQALVTKEMLIQKDLFEIPNILHESVPEGLTDNENQEVKKWGKIKEQTFTVKPHDEIAKELDILDIERGVKIAGSRFYILKKEGALLERALAQFFLDEAINNGYIEIFAPLLVREKTMFGTGQLPKFKDDAFKIEDENLYLIPTAEVSVTSLYQGEILKEQDLPMRFCSFSSCFRRESGSYGKDTKGIFRVHQFQKVELVHYSHPSESMSELERMVSHAESLLEKLEIPYRRILLCAGDTGFSSSKTYDLEAYFPAEKRYREIASISNCGEFQARRGNIKFKNSDGKNVFLHTLNGSGLAVGRTWISIIENYQNKDGSITIPKVLQPYMHGMTKIGGK